MNPLILDTLDYARSLRGGSSLVNIIGTNEKTDISVSKTANGFRVAIVNHNPRELSILLKPTEPNLIKSSWIDLVNDKAIETVGNDSLKLTVPARSFRAVEYRKK